MKCFISLFVLFFSALSLHAQSVESDNYYNQGLLLYKQKRYSEAACALQNCYELDKKEMSDKDNRKYNSEAWYAHCLYLSGDTVKARSISDTQHDYCILQPVDRNLTHKIDSLCNIVLEYMDKGASVNNIYKDADKMIPILLSVKQEEQNIFQDKPYELIGTFHLLSNCFAQMGQQKLAVENKNKSIELTKKWIGKNSYIYVTLLCELAYLYNSSPFDFEKDKARVLSLEADSIAVINNMPHSPQVAETAYNMLFLQNKQEEMVSQMRYDFSRLLDGDLGVLSFYVYLAGRVFNVFARSDYEKKEAAIDLGLEIENKIKNTEINDTALVLLYGGIGSLYMGIHDSENAIVYKKKAVNLAGERKDLAITQLTDLLMVCFKQESLSICKEIATLAKQTPLKNGLDSINYHSTLASIATKYQDMGDFKNAESSWTEAYDFIVGVLGKSHPWVILDEIGQGFCRQVLSNFSYREDIAQLYAEINDTLEAKYNRKELNAEALIPYLVPAGFYEKIAYFYMVSNMNLFLSQRSDIKRLFNKSIFDKIKDSIIIPSYGNNHPLCLLFQEVDVLNSLGRGEFSKALSMANRISKLRKEQGLGTSPTLSIMSSFLSYVKLDMSQGQEDLKEYINGYKKMVIDNFRWMTNDERTTLWSQYRSIFEMPLRILDALQVAGRKRGTNETISLAYDAQLFCKGMLLNSEMSLQKMIQSTGNIELINLYEKWRSLRSQIDQINISPEEYSPEKNLLLHDEAYSIERELLERCSEFGDYTKLMAVTWEDVQSSLNENDLAIEFVKYPSMDNPKYSFYGALLLSKSGFPKFIRICSEKEIVENSVKDGIKFVWSPLKKYLKEGSNIYFAADGILHKYNLEDCEIIRNANFYRLSSTRELTKAQKYLSEEKVTLYGGVQYSLSIEDRQKNSLVKPTKNKGLFRDSPSYREFRETGISVTPLKGSQEEVELISHLLKERGISQTLYTGAMATEESFKELSGACSSVVHVSTHGFYDSNKTEFPIVQNQIRIWNIGSSSEISNEELSLSKSGVLLAGAEDYINGNMVSDLSDDGILTAREIAHLDLRGLDLAVLSACQTAQGEITGDGVFGLQRGFKKAGTNSILMSLWKVDDKATCLLMTEFYKNWIGKGKSKHQALELAKQEVRSRKGWEDPKYWAAFILLDGLD